MERIENVTVKPNSFEGRHGGVATGFKIYFDSVEDIKAGIDAVLEGKKYLAEKLAEVQLVEGGEAK